MIISYRRRNIHQRGFSLIELMVAGAIGGVLLAGVLAASLHITRRGVQLANYSAMELQARGALERFGADARIATNLVTNSAGDITLSVPDADNVVSSVTYAWTSATSSFFRVPGTSSAATAGRTILVTGITAPTGSTGVVFERLDRLDASTTSDASTKSVRVSFAVSRSTSSTGATSQYATGVFALRNKVVP